MIQEDVVFQRPKSSNHELKFVRNRETQQNVDSLIGMESESIVHPDDCLFFDPLERARVEVFLLLGPVSASAQLCKARYNQVSNLAELRVAADEEHVSGDAIDQHLLARDSVVAQC